MHRRSQWLQRSLLVAAGILLAASLARAQNLTSAQLDAVKARLAEGATHSWELGTRAQALLEADTPSYSVLTVDAALPPPREQAPSSLDDVISIARSVVQNRTRANIDGPQPLMDASGGAAGDPPSIGVSVLLANWTGAGGRDGLDYVGAARDQLQFLLEKVPRTSDGAISHRMEEVQLWSDFVYMVPPFLAYYGVLAENQSLLQEAYDQCRLYRHYLMDGHAGGMWRHMALGRPDTGHWTTGNGWAAAGMLRVLATIQKSKYARHMKKQAKDLVNWVNEIHNGIYPHLQANGLFKNYADDGGSFDDASGTAILASTAYRLALLAGVHTHLPAAERSRTALSAPAASNGSALAHFTADMWLRPVVNPDSFGSEGDRSPEGQAFVVEMYAAWEEWGARGEPGRNAAAPRVGCGANCGGGALVVALGVAVALSLRM